MPRSNTFRSYGSVAKTFHWLTALLIIAVIPLGLVANDLAGDIRNPAIATGEDDVARAAFLFSFHKTIGLAILAVSLARILWMLGQIRPGLLNAAKRTETLAAQTVHWLLYGMLVLVPLSGWVHHGATAGFAPIWWPFGQRLFFVPEDPDLAGFAAALHRIFAWLLILSLGLHVAGALKHHLIDRDATLHRMLPGSSDHPAPPPQTHGPLAVTFAIAALVGAVGVGAWTGMFARHHQRPEAAPLARPQSDWRVTDGSLSIAITQLGSPVTGNFANWTAAIAFDDPLAAGPAGSVRVTVDIASLTLGSVTAQALGPDYFDAETYPTATFTGTIEKSGPGYVASGPLTIRDQSVPISLPFTLETEGQSTRMRGQATLDRLDFGIGATLPNETSLAFGVDVMVDITAIRAPAEN